MRSFFFLFHRLFHTVHLIRLDAVQHIIFIYILYSVVSLTHSRDQKNVWNLIHSNVICCLCELSIIDKKEFITSNIALIPFHSSLDFWIASPIRPRNARIYLSLFPFLLNQNFVNGIHSKQSWISFHGIPIWPNCSQLLSSKSNSKTHSCLHQNREEYNKIVSETLTLLKKVVYWSYFDTSLQSYHWFNVLIITIIVSCFILSVAMEFFFLGTDCRNLKNERQSTNKCHWNGDVDRETEIHAMQQIMFNKIFSNNRLKLRQKYRLCVIHMIVETSNFKLKFKTWICFLCNNDTKKEKNRLKF